MLLAGLGVTLFATFYLARTLELRSRAQFDASVQHIQTTVPARFETYVALLRGVTGYFASAEHVTRAKFKAYVDRVEMATNYPGIEGIGFSIRIQPSQLDELTATLRAQGQTNFHVWPDYPREAYHSIIYLEPQTDRNLAAIGYDMFTEPVRRAAMEAARDGGRRAASGKVTLLQEIKGVKQAGFLIYLPVYEGGSVPETIEERRLRLRGFVYAPFRIGDLWTSMIGPELLDGMEIEVFDGNQTRPENLVFSSARPTKAGWPSSHYESQAEVDVAGRIWLIHLRETSVYGGAFWLVPLLLAGGVLLSFTFFYLTRLEARVRHRAEEAAAQLRLSEQALRDSETRLRLILESARDYAIFAMDPSGQVVSWNAGAERLFGYSESEIIGRNAEIIFTPEDRAQGAPQEELTKALQSGLAGDDRWHQRKEGTRLFVSGVVRPMSDDSGKLVGFIKVARDVTDRLQAAERLQNEKMFSDTIINSLPGVFYLFDYDGKWIRWNESFQAVTGYSPEEIFKRPPANFFEAEDQKIIAAAIQQVIDTGQASAEADLTAKDGRKIPHLFFGRRINLGGKPCVMGMGVDITQRKRAEQELRAAEEQMRNYTAQLEQRVAERTVHLRQSLQSLEGLLYHVAHDLRAPLRAMASFTRILLEEYSDRFDAEGQDYARRIATAAHFMDELVEDLLAYGRLSHMSVTLHKVSLTSQLDAVLEQLAPEIDGGRARVEVQRPLPTVKGNSHIIYQILLNLIGNALKFVPAGRTPDVRIRADRMPSAVRLWVEDNGIGISPEYQQRIFRVFERLHSQNEYPGTGMGLAIVQKGVERMDGRAGVESTPGAGSRFWIELPPSD